MDERERALSAIGVRSIARLLDELAAIRARAATGEEVVVPRVTLHLKSGRDASGHVVTVGSDGRSPMVLFQLPGSDARRVAVDALWVDPESIEALTIHGAGELAYLFVDGGMAPPGVPPTKLEVKRKVEELVPRLSAAVGKAIAIEVAWEAIEAGEPLRQLGLAIADAVAILIEIAREPVGKEALGAVSSLHFVAGAPEVNLTDGALTIGARFAEGPSGRLTRADLRAAIEARL